MAIQLMADSSQLMVEIASSYFCRSFPEWRTRNGRGVPGTHGTWRIGRQWPDV